MALPAPEPFGVEEPELAKQMTIAAIMSDYKFSVFKTDEKNKQWHSTLYLAHGGQDTTAITRAIREGIVIGQATSRARAWADMPANLRTPTVMAQQAKALAQKHGLKYTIFGVKKAKSLGMGGFCSVTEGSDQPGVFVVLEYTAQAKDAPTIALVGKGVCFDSGGLHLKKREFMDKMHYDLCGATAVLATMDAVARLKPMVNVVALMPFVENMPSGKAAKIGDIVTFMNGKTALINSTDAEGRIILADALCYAEKFYKPSVIIDIATLTGAQRHALGHFYRTSSN